MKFEIKNRWSGDVQFTCELSAEVAEKSYWFQLGFAVKAASVSGANLRDADLIGANLSGADLRDADLRDADLIGANLSGANLRGADLRDADLRDANLSGANLRGADLRDADLRDADLRDADLIGANLSGASLRGADLRDADLIGANLSGANLRDADLSGASLSNADLSGANLSGADLRSIRADFYDVLAWSPAEVPVLIKALEDGRVDGSTYSGDCACLVGTIANVRGVDFSTLPHDSSRPIESFFAAINKGDTPETSQFSAIALGWAEEWLASMRKAFGPVTEKAS